MRFLHRFMIHVLTPLLSVFVSGEQAFGEDPYKSAGNITPTIPELAPEVVAQYLADVKVPPGFTATLYAPWQTANYPVFVAASPAGDVYVSSDGNASLGRDPDRGRVLRLRDTNGDGRADQVTEFVKSIDSPRGIVWDHDRLYLLHPPHISVFFDRDGDGISEESRRLISDIAFGFKDRPADHTTNGLELGPDGWLYVATGDFGFMKATGADGRSLQLRGGGVVRFRPDGSGLEVFATGTRNILATPMSPLLDMFARDNTNDGGGWNVRFHHFSGLEEHGYPRLYMHFPDEHIHPLADYGGGSGCGGVYIHEPGFPAEWASAPFTCDWGKAGLFHHKVERTGAGFRETRPPETFIGISRPTDADVDGMSRIYQASWKGSATFNWNGPESGYIIRVTPDKYAPEPLPDFNALPDGSLIALLDSPSQVRALAAQRTLLRRDPGQPTTDALLGFAADGNRELRARILALYAISQRGVDSRRSAEVIALIRPLANDASISAFVMRTLGDMGIDLLTAGQPGPAPSDLLIKGIRSTDPRTSLEAIIAAARQRQTACADAIAAHLGNQDPVIAHTAFQALAILDTPDPAFALLDAPSSTGEQRRGAALALMRMHSRPVVDGLMQRLDNPSHPAFADAFSALSRLHYREDNWTGDHWGGRPDNRGPYYKPAEWEASADIRSALTTALTASPANLVPLLLSVMRRDRIETGAEIQRLVEMAETDREHIPALLDQLTGLSDIPEPAIPLLQSVALDAEIPAAERTKALQCLLTTERREVLPAVLGAVAGMDTITAEKKIPPAAEAFLNHPRLAGYKDALAEASTGDPGSPQTYWAFAGLLKLASPETASPEVRSMAQTVLDQAWEKQAHRMVLMLMAARLDNHVLDQQIAETMSHANLSLAQVARQAASTLHIQLPTEDTSPRIGSLNMNEVLRQVETTQGDVALGKTVFAQASCTSCHAVREDLPQKGPYLGSIASIYRRQELAEAILDPGKTIAQGFATHLITLKDNRTIMGFIIKETADLIELRDIAAQSYTVETADIAKRTTLPSSMMPPGLMNSFSVQQFASLLDYLESLVGK